LWDKIWGTGKIHTYNIQVEVEEASCEESDATTLPRKNTSEMRFNSKAPSNPFRSQRNDNGNGNGASSTFLPVSRSKLWMGFLLIELFWIRQYYRSYQLQHQPMTLDVNANANANHNNQLPNAFIAHFSNDPIHVRNSQHSMRTRSDNTQPSPPDPNKMDVPEPGYPKETHLVDYKTSASQQEVEKHDRFLIQGMHYMKTHDFEPLSRTIAHHESQRTSPPKICLNLYLCNRRIPYINSLLLSLTSFSTSSNEEDLIQLAQVHLLNTEKRPERLHFRYMREKLSKLPFVSQVHNITYRDEIYKNITDRELIFREMFISDEISGLKICLESGLEYCVMMEEDAVVPVDFMTLLNQQVIQPLEALKEEGVLQVDGSGGISVLSLYSYFNLVYKGVHRLHDPRYAKRRYVEDAATGNAERFSKTMPPFRNEYEMVEKEYMYGTVAMVYTRASAEKLVKYLQQVGVDPIHNADEFMNANDYFPTEMGIPRKSVEPSLVNHIGYYSERMADFTANGMFSQLNTDSRFMFDAGEV
jgi:hypothetical protein